jgi:hypothetical protein
MLVAWLVLVISLTGLLAHAQTIAAKNCHNLEIALHGPWGDYAIPAGVNEEKPGELLWAIIKVDVLRIFVDLADLDEDNVHNHAIFSLEYIGKHQKGKPYVADTPTVIVGTKGLNTKMTVNTVDLDKIKALDGQREITESQMGLTIDRRKAAFFLFIDQEHADAFEKAIKKAIVVCKAQE